jgi:hypothetical protein
MDSFEDDVVIQDDAFYELKEFGVRLDGKLLKDPVVFKILKEQYDLQQRIRRSGLVIPRDRCFEIDSEIQVVERAIDPPCYMIVPKFAGIKQLRHELDLPKTSKTRFFSKFIPGGDYVGVNGAARKHLQEFTVELFGLVIAPKRNRRAHEKTELPDPRQYAIEPRYWYQSARELIQIWRTRIFWSAPKRFTPSPANPLTPYRPTFPYLEERWHPRSKLTGITLGGLDQFLVGFSLLEQFHTTACGILLRSHTNAGRPRLFPDGQQFIDEVKLAYLAIWREKKYEPAQKEVAKRLSCNPLTFKDYWRKFGIMPWHDLYELWITKTSETSRTS